MIKTKIDMLSTIRRRLEEYFYPPYNHYEIRKRLFKDEYNYILSREFYANTAWMAFQNTLFDHEVSKLLAGEDND